MLVPVAVIVTHRVRAAFALGAAMREAAAMGGPVTLEQMEAARRQWPDDRNGANVLREVEPDLDALTRRLDAPDSELFPVLPVIGGMPDPEPGHRWPDQTITVVERFLDDHRPQLDTLDRLKDSEGGRFPPALPQPPKLQRPAHLVTFRTAVRLKSLACVANAARGDNRAFLDDVTVIRRAARLLDDEPLLFSSLIGAASDDMAAHVLEQVLCLGTLDPACLQAVQASFAGYDPYPRIIYSLRAERAWFIAVADWLRQNSSNIADNSSLPGGIRMPGGYGRLASQEARGILVYDRLIRRPDADAVLREAKSVVQELAADPNELLPEKAFSLVIKALELHMKCAAEIRCAETAAAVERYRLVNDRRPDRLEDIVPRFIAKLPEDPFDPGQPVRMVHRDGRTVIYSVGTNRQDDAGELLKEDGVQPDVGFTLLDPDLRNRPALPESRPASRSAD